MTDTKEEWTPPGHDCGLCGAPDCETFIRRVREGIKEKKDCPYYHGQAEKPEEKSDPRDTVRYSGIDIVGNHYDFIMDPFTGEPSARKIILPFRPDMVERMDIGAGDTLLGRPMGAGCPVQHVLSVLSSDQITGLLTCHVVSPMIARDNHAAVKDIRAYHVIGFEGIAQTIKNPPEFGRRQRFLPGYCMMDLSHTGVVNMVIQTKAGMVVRVEDIRI